MTKYYVYQLKTNEGEIFYIGKGTGKRMYKHIQIAKGNSINKTKNLKLYNKINYVLNNGGYILSEIIFESEDENECHLKECEIIQEFGLDNLCNLTLGGEGTSGYKLSDETRQKMSNYWKGRKSNSTGTIRTDEFKEAAKQKMLGKKNCLGHRHSDDTKERMSKAKKGKKTGTITEERRLAIIEGIKKKKEESSR